jgi:predicted O-methyltransferase YrrM
MNNYFILFLIFLNLFLIYYYNKRKVKNLFFKSQIQSVDLEKVHNIFLPSENRKFKFPKEETIVNLFFINPSFNIVGMTQDYEAWILSSLAKLSKNIFEFGTCSGKTTTLFALNSPQDSKINTITLNPDHRSNLSFQQIDGKIASRNAVRESIYNEFIFSNMSIKNKINVIFQDSMQFNIDRYLNSMDLIFIDGGHNYTCVKNDSEKSFDMIKDGGYIFWHDYNVSKRSCRDVVKYIHEISKVKKIFHIKNTSLCYYKK